ncbi:peptidylprolyl isomerase [Marinihelvus fidelis]|uniref:Peptidyl-prolyl cis-trans isomerase n=1 Tax=Marinihelvus fidelis TaxID=2613842 RepID=A0A5N0T5N8_9GAMM|nr:peptidylprolyl isomerase [Marinihelvus fidelis]KAA9129774.1 peptidylprolyl isomerase [Marinihelvus fidelis]
MNIEKEKVVSFHYTLTNDDGETLDSSRERGEPMSYLHGAGNIIPGLEKQLEGKAAGDAFQVTVPPAEAYGERQEANVQRLPLKKLGVSANQLQPGMILNLQTNQGPAQVTVLKVGRFNVDVDANHPLAGQPLNFDVEVMDVRDATDEEKEHGHAHGPGGHDHG